MHLRDGHGVALRVLQGAWDGIFPFFFFLFLILYFTLMRWQVVSLCVVVLWIVVSVGTLKGVVSGRLFSAPCLANLKTKEDERNATKAA
jgi:hypothetical protein